MGLFGEVKDVNFQTPYLMLVQVGENVLNIASSAKLLIGIDNSNGMIETAHSI